MSESFLDSSDLDLLAGLKAQEPTAYEALYKRYYAMVETFILQNNGSREDARDIFQESMIALFRSVSKLEFQLYKDATLTAFIMAIARKTWYNTLRKKKKMALANEDESLLNKLNFSLESEEKGDLEKKYDLIGEKFKQLNKDCQGLLLAYYFEGKSLKEIAVQMGYTGSFIKVKKYRCMQNLKNLVHSIAEKKNKK